MTILQGIIQDGVVRLSLPTDLPNGTEVTVLANSPSKTLGIPDDEWPSDHDAVAQLLARMDRVEPFELTPEEVAEIESWRLRVKQHTLVTQNTVIDGLFE